MDISRDLFIFDQNSKQYIIQIINCVLLQFLRAIITGDTIDYFFYGISYVIQYFIIKKNMKKLF